MPKKQLPALKVTVSGPALFIQVPSNRAMELHRFLRSRGVSTNPPAPCSDDIDTIDLGKGTNVQAVQALLDQWSQPRPSA
jgi:hypothetical protein